MSTVAREGSRQSDKRGRTLSAKHAVGIRAGKVSEARGGKRRVEKRALMATRQKSIHRRRDHVAWVDRIS